MKNKKKTSIKGTGKRPRLVVFRSNAHIFAQIINDAEGKTLAVASSLKMESGANVKAAKEVGLLIGKVAKEAKIKSVIFDRNRYIFKGRVKALANGAREAGLEF